MRLAMVCVRLGASTTVSVPAGGLRILLVLGVLLIAIVLVLLAGLTARRRDEAMRGHRRGAATKQMAGRRRKGWTPISGALYLVAAVHHGLGS